MYIVCMYVCMYIYIYRHVFIYIYTLYTHLEMVILFFLILQGGGKRIWLVAVMVRVFCVVAVMVVDRTA